MDNDASEPLVDRYLGGTATPADLAALETQLQGDPQARRQFAERLLLEIHLRKAFATVAPAVVVTPRQRRTPHWLPWVVAALLLVAVSMAFLRRGPHELPVSPSMPAVVPTVELLAGVVRVDGTAVTQVPENRWFEVAADAPAVLRLADGSEAELQPASKALVRPRGADGRPGFDLERGGGRFKVTPGAGRFQVTTGVANVTVLGTEFTLRLDVRKGEGKRSRGRPTLAVAVTEGSVRVDYGGRSAVLGAGERRTFEWKKEDDDD